MSKAAIASARERRRTGLPLLRYGFRPFFLGAALFALVAMAIRLGNVFGIVAGGPALRDPTLWHAHEMVFGYASAVVAGFALTAVPNWTGRLPISGTPLLALCALWLAGRLALLIEFIPPPVAATIDASFLPILAVVLGREILAGRNFRNIPVCALIMLLAAANIVSHLEALDIVPWAGYGERAGIGMLCLLIGLIGGRIVPSFTNNWLGRQGLVRAATPQPLLERFVHVASAVALVAWIVAPDAAPTGVALLIAAGAHAFRLFGWRGWRAWREPLVLVLHVAYAWIAIGYLLLGLAAVADGTLRSAGLHALGVGAIGGMTLAVMTRATLGHTGRLLRANAGTVLIYTAIALSAAARVGAGLLAGAYIPLLITAAVLWLIAFALFVGFYGPMLLAPRVGDPA